MCLKINWSVNRPDLGLARELLASGYGLLLPPAAMQWTVFRNANTKIFRLNPTLFLVTFEIKL